MKILLAQINPTVGAIGQNLDRILQAIRQARELHADLVVFPELVLSGAPLHDLLFHHDFVEKCEEALQRIAAASSNLAIIIGSPATDGMSVFDAAIIFSNGKEIGRQHDVCWPWDIGGKKIGVIVGEASPKTLAEPVEWLIHIAASPWSKEALDARIHSVKERAKNHRCPYLFANLVGANDGWIFDGNSFFCDAEGSVSFQGRPFAETIAIINEKGPALLDISSLEQTRQALVLGISDFFRKQGIADAIVGLSGGIDSTVTAALAAEALGADHVQGVLLPSLYSSPKNIEGAEAAASLLGIRIRKIDIEPIATAAASALCQGGVVISDRAATKLQSRIRSLLMMAISNSEGSFLLSSVNKTDMALGTATLYGELCGALLPLGDLFKSDVSELARHLNLEKLIIPQQVLENHPSADPRSYQKDINDLPSYDLLDPVVQLLVLEGLSPLQVTAKTGMRQGIVQQTAEKMLSSEFKRRQSPCLLRVSSKAFGTEIMYPIVNRYKE
jgi:NAD+ synthase (glutamine-hydrolysing)